MGLDFDRSILSVLKLSQLDENMKEISLIWMNLLFILKIVNHILV